MKTEKNSETATYKALIFLLEHVSIQNPELARNTEQLANEVHTEYGAEVLPEPLPEPKPVEKPVPVKAPASERFDGRFGKRTRPAATKEK